MVAPGQRKRRALPVGEQALGARGRQRSQNREAKSAADLLGGVEQARGETCILGRGALERV